MKNKHLKVVVERLIAIEKSIVKLTDGFGFCDPSNPPAKWHYPVKRARANSKTRYRLLCSFAAEFPESSGKSDSGLARTEMEDVLESLKGDIREYRVSHIVGDVLLALNFAAIQYSMLLAAKVAGNQNADDELQKLAEDGLNSSADSCAEIREHPPMLLALELNPEVEDAQVDCLGFIVEQAWAPPEED